MGCADLTTDVTNCGSCGNVCPAGPNTTATCDANGCGTVCNAGYADCNADPTDGCEIPLNTLTDCGACGVACSIPGATASCATGTCTFTTCDATHLDCNQNTADGCEIDGANDAANCGGCGQACVTGEICSQGHCAVSTPSGPVYPANCAELPTGLTDGEYSLDYQHDPSKPFTAYCSFANGSSYLTLQVTSLDPSQVPTHNFSEVAGGGCYSGFSDTYTRWQKVRFDGASGLVDITDHSYAATDADAGGGPVDYGVGAGCCGPTGNFDVDLTGLPFFITSGWDHNQGPDNYYGNGDVTLSANQTIADGYGGGSCGAEHPDVGSYPNYAIQLAYACGGNQVVCSSVCVDPASFQADVNNCGGCGNACSANNNQTATCNAGSCGATCNAGFADCNADPSDGCEIDTTSDVANCGGCGQACPADPGYTATCTNSVCGETCPSGLVCSGTCEPIDDPNHCGDCNTVCSGATPFCNGTTCAALPDQCTTATVIDDPTRSATGAGAGSCDNGLVQGWYRFEGSAGTVIPTTAVSENHCGTQAPGWLSTAMPASLGQTVAGTVCYSWYSANNCTWTSDIQVTNCGSYYVYNLPPPQYCNLRYCVSP